MNNIITRVPIISKYIQPWKNDSDPTSKPSNDILQNLLEDLSGCAIGYWKKYKVDGYTVDHALSDAYAGMLKAIDKDKSAPKLNKNVTCPKCSGIFMPYCPGDEIADRIFQYAPKNRVPSKRNILINCPNCDHSWHKTIYKTIFSTHVNPYIRGEIQSGVRKYKSRHVSLDGNRCGDNNLHDILGSRPEIQNEGLPGEILTAIYNIINSFHGRDKETIVMYFGIGGIVNDKVISKMIKCKYCCHDYNAAIDYSLSHNFSECPECQCENQVDMKINQTNIADTFNISKQRIGSIVKKIKEKFIIELTPLLIKHDIQL